MNYIFFILGKPTPTLTWYRDKVEANVDYTMKNDDIVTSGIEITNLKRSDISSRFMCVAYNSNITEAKFKKFSLELNCKYTLQIFFLHCGKVPHSIRRCTNCTSI